MVMGRDSRFKGCEFESQHHILDGHFFTYICCGNCIVCLKRPKINEKEAGLGLFLKKAGQKLINYFIFRRSRVPGNGDSSPSSSLASVMKSRSSGGPNYSLVKSCENVYTSNVNTCPVII